MIDQEGRPLRRPAYRRAISDPRRRIELMDVIGWAVIAVVVVGGFALVVINAHRALAQHPF